MADGLLTFEKPLIESGEIAKRISDKLGVEASSPRQGWIEIAAPREKIKPLCQMLHRELSFEHITDLAGVDYTKTLAVVYHVYSYRNICTAQIIAELPADDPAIDTVSDIWGGANWHEREAYDMFGITFTGHPWLKRILLPEDFEGHPLLKSYKLKTGKEWDVDKDKALAVKKTAQRTEGGDA